MSQSVQNLNSFFDPSGNRRISLKGMQKRMKAIEGYLRTLQEAAFHLRKDIGELQSDLFYRPQSKKEVSHE